MLVWSVLFIAVGPFIHHIILCSIAYADSNDNYQWYSIGALIILFAWIVYAINQFWSVMLLNAAQDLTVTQDQTSVSSNENRNDTVDDINIIEPGCCPIPSPYQLCQFPDNIQRLLETADPALATQPFYRNRIRKILCDDMARYTLYVHTKFSH